MNPRSEPLLWLQLVALGAIPLELLGLVLVLAGTDPGPWPGLERLLTWALGGLGPAILLWRRPADVCSLLVVQVPIKGRSEAQRTLASLQSPLPVQLAMLLGAIVLLPLLWWIDQHAALAAALSPLAASPRFVCLLLACPLLALILWQWQQLLQAVRLLGRPSAALAAATPLSTAQLEQQRLCLGLPLLLPSPLQIPEEQTRAPAAGPGQVDNTPVSPEPSVAEAVAIDPEQTAEQPEGTDLDEQIP